MWNDFVNYILEEVADKTVNIAEVGVGQYDYVANILSQKENINLIKIDIKPKDESIIKDDITNPDLELYEHVNIIYSIILNMQIKLLVFLCGIVILNIM